MSSLSCKASGKVCRICLVEQEEPTRPSPCKCSGSLGYVHTSCLDAWIAQTNHVTCEICHYPIQSSTQTFRSWLYLWFLHYVTRSLVLFFKVVNKVFMFVCYYILVITAVQLAIDSVLLRKELEKWLVKSIDEVFLGFHKMYGMVGDFISSQTQILQYRTD